jgi:hypothetical protein
VASEIISASVVLQIGAERSEQGLAQIVRSHGNLR